MFDFVLQWRVQNRYFIFFGVQVRRQCSKHCSNQLMSVTKFVGNVNEAQRVKIRHIRHLCADRTFDRHDVVLPFPQASMIVQDIGLTSYWTRRILYSFSRGSCFSVLRRCSMRCLWQKMEWKPGEKPKKSTHQHLWWCTWRARRLSGRTLGTPFQMAWTTFISLLQQRKEQLICLWNILGLKWIICSNLGVLHFPVKKVKRLRRIERSRILLSTTLELAGLSQPR